MRIFGHIPGIVEGSLFASRMHLHEAGLHRPLRAGISGGAREGADSIIMSPAFEDNVDEGNVIIYAGAGGRSPRTGRQVAHQHMAGANLALYHSLQHGLPVRVVRNILTDEGYQYRYDGLYSITNLREITGISGYKVLLFRLERLA